MSDCCDKCGSYRLKPYKGCNETEYHPPECDGWECLECGHIQVPEKDYDYYEEDFV